MKSSTTFAMLATAVFTLSTCLPALAQPSPAAAAAAAANSTTANGGTGGVGLGGVGPGVGVQPDSAGAAGVSSLGRPSGNGALVGPRARQEASELLQQKPQLQDRSPTNSGQRAILIDKEQRSVAPDPNSPAR